MIDQKLPTELIDIFVQYFKFKYVIAQKLPTELIDIILKQTGSLSICSRFSRLISKSTAISVININCIRNTIKSIIFDNKLSELIFICNFVDINNLPVITIKGLYFLNPFSIFYNEKLSEVFNFRKIHGTPYPLDNELIMSTYLNSVKIYQFLYKIDNFKSEFNIFWKINYAKYWGKNDIVKFLKSTSEYQLFKVKKIK